MAKPVDKITLGIDVAKDQLVVAQWGTEPVTDISNQPEAIAAFLDELSGPVRIALEPTSHYHLALVEAALSRGHEVYLINPRQLVHYRQAVNGRHKTDAEDARLLARYLTHEAAQLRAFQPQDRRARRLWALLSRRATVVQSQQRLQQSMRQVQFSIAALLSQFQHVLRRLDQQIQRLLRELGWWSDYQRCQSIPGIGPANAAALVAAYHRGAFAGSDAFVAYLGLDIRLRESGRLKGKSKLTKRGAGELRRLLYCATHAAGNHPRFAAYRERLLNKGLSKIAARVALARKLARIAFTLMSNQQTFAEPPQMS
ncbi:MAG: IS110 family transposase [Lysobacterales bacterium]